MGAYDDDPGVTHVGLRVRLLNDPCLWSWELVDPVTNRLLESGWQEHWAAYDSAAEAYTAGARRLALVPR